MRRAPNHLITITYFLPLFMLATVLMGIPSYASQPLRLVDADKAQILRSALHREMGKTKRTEGEPILLLNNENINQDWLPTIPNVKITLIDADEIKAKRATASEFSYYFFSKLEVRGSKVIVWFGKYEKRKRSSSAAGTIYQYRRVSGKWRGKATGGFNSCAAPAQEDKENPDKQ